MLKWSCLYTEEKTTRQEGNGRRWKGWMGYQTSPKRCVYCNFKGKHLKTGTYFFCSTRLFERSSKIWWVFKNSKDRGAVYSKKKTNWCNVWVHLPYPESLYFFLYAPVHFVHYTSITRTDEDKNKRMASAITCPAVCTNTKCNYFILILLYWQYDISCSVCCSCWYYTTCMYTHFSKCCFYTPSLRPFNSRP